MKAPTVSQWCSGLRPIPAPRAMQIEILTNGQVIREYLCPDFPWDSAGAQVRSTLKQIMDGNSTAHKSSDGAGVLYSAKQAPHEPA